VEDYAIKIIVNADSNKDFAINIANAPMVVLIIKLEIE